MWDAAVVRSQSFIDVIRCSSNEEVVKSLRTIRAQYAGDLWSEVEIDRWIALYLAKANKNEAAYALLLAIKPRLDEFQYNTSIYHFEIIGLFQRPGKLDEIQDYCK